MIVSCSTTSIDLLSFNKLHQLDDAANFLMFVSDGEKELQNTCGLSSDEALNMLRALHAQIDQEIQSGNYTVPEGVLNSCLGSCHCGIYSDLAVDSIIKDDLYKKAQSTSKAQKINCAQRSSVWLCQSKILSDLKAESSNELGTGL